MANLFVENFQGGLDARKMRVTSIPGSLLRCENAHISRGGEIEKGRAFVKTADLPDGTFGLAAAAGVFYVFGNEQEPVGIPGNVTYRRLVHPTDPNTPMTKWLSGDFFDGKPYSCAEYADGSIHNFYDEAFVQSIPDNNYKAGTFAKTVRSKMYYVRDSLLHYSNVNDPTTFMEDEQVQPPLTGAGFDNLSNAASGSEELQAIGIYFDNIAVAAKDTIQIWFVESDPALNVQLQVLNNTGVIAPKSMVGFGDNDVFYLAESGIRSLRARNSSNAAFVDDVGTAIDPLIEAAVQANREQVEDAVGIIEPREGRFLLAIGDQIYVFSFFPTSDITAWSTYNPGFTISDFAYTGQIVGARSGNSIYLLGGESGFEYDNSEVIVRLPFMHAESPWMRKAWESFDVASEGAWEVRAYPSVHPEEQDISFPIAEFEDTTYGVESIPIGHEGTHISLEFRSTDAKRAKLGNLKIDYNELYEK